MSFISMGNKRITPAALSQLYKSIQAGGSITDAARLANISRQAYYNLIKAERKKPASPILDKIAQAQARHRLHLQSQIMAAGKHSWQACAWLLERKYPSMFGRKDAQLANELRQLRNELDAIRGLMQSTGRHQDK